MTQAHESFENSTLVEAWLKEPTFLEPVDEGRVATIVHQTPQVRRWPPRVDLGRFAPMLNATKFVAASVILALTGGLLINVLPTEPASNLVPAAESATATATATATPDAVDERSSTVSVTPVISPPDELPEDVESGTIETPAGPARWVRLDASGGAVPRFPTQVVPWGEGIATMDGADGTLMRTENGVDWVAVAGPAPGHPTYLDGSYFVVNAEAGRVWTSDGPGSVWQELDTSAIQAVQPEGWQARRRSLATGPMLVDDQIVFVLRSSYRLPYEQLGIPISQQDKTRAMKRLSPDRYALCGTGTGRASCRQADGDAKWILRFSRTPMGLGVLNDRTGKRLGHLDGASLSELYEGSEGRRHDAFAIEGDTVVRIASPWPGIDAQELAGLTLAPGGATPVLKWWDSRGSTDPAATGLASIAAEVPNGGRLTVTNHPDRLEAFARGPRQHAVGTAWTSVDGVTWTAAPTNIPERAEPEWTGSSWLATRRIKNDRHRWMHLGGDWVSLDVLGIPDAPAVGIGNVTLFGWSDELWVLFHPEGERET